MIHRIEFLKRAMVTIAAPFGLRYATKDEQHEVGKVLVPHGRGLAFSKLGKLVFRDGRSAELLCSTIAGPAIIRYRSPEGDVINNEEFVGPDHLRRAKEHFENLRYALAIPVIVEFTEDRVWLSEEQAFVPVLWWRVEGANSVVIRRHDLETGRVLETLDVVGDDVARSSIQIGAMGDPHGRVAWPWKEAADARAGVWHQLVAENEYGWQTSGTGKGYEGVPAIPGEAIVPPWFGDSYPHLPAGDHIGAAADPLWSETAHSGPDHLRHLKAHRRAFGHLYENDQ